jgi:DNA-binding CsgD family transcriptional regulator
MLLAGEHATAAPLAEEALGAFDRLGAVAERDRAMAELGGTGLVPSMRRRVAADAGWASLTDSERRVAVLLADGLSNPEIAGRLFVAPRTVSTHVSHILRKLGLRSRTEVAVMVARQAARDHGHPMTERQY